MKLFDLSGRVALVTGGNGGIGLGMAKGFADAGATVAIAGRNAAKAEKALETIGSRAIFVEVDVTDAESCRAMVARTVERLGRLDILVNNAGVANRKRPELFSPDEWHAVLDANLSGAFFASQAAYFEMKRGGGGKMINIGSMMSIFGAAFAGAYAASKGGIVQLTKALAASWAPDNIQVNAVLPGWIETELTQQAQRD
ncbi:MAG TPA: SDR family NAD(P)-dependent oxidoreductase, partial [Beijerinckiaceae bacterium]|nr:SDR family NAD(P)-dependent oxidoreductase [Beijerinckiaceae bacterium]